MTEKKFISIDIMDVYDDKFICTLRFPRPALWPIIPIPAKELFDFIYLKRPSLKQKYFTVHVG